MKVWKLIGLALVMAIMVSMVAACGEEELTGDIVVLTNVNVIPIA